MSENAVAQQIVDAAYRVHTALGPGLLESVYQAALAYELEKRGLRVTRQQSIPVVYETVRIDTGFHADLMVEDQVIVEIKAVEIVAPVHKKQSLTYLRLADTRAGAARQLQCRSDQGRHHSHRQSSRGMISRKAAKPDLLHAHQTSL